MRVIEIPKTNLSVWYFSTMFCQLYFIQCEQSVVKHIFRWAYQYFKQRQLLQDLVINVKLPSFTGWSVWYKNSRYSFLAKWFIYTKSRVRTNLVQFAKTMLGQIVWDRTAPSDSNKGLRIQRHNEAHFSSALSKSATRPKHL